MKTTADAELVLQLLADLNRAQQMLHARNQALLKAIEANSPSVADEKKTVAAQSELLMRMLADLQGALSRQHDYALNRRRAP